MAYNGILSVNNPANNGTGTFDGLNRQQWGLTSPNLDTDYTSQISPQLSDMTDNSVPDLSTGGGGGDGGGGGYGGLVNKNGQLGTAGAAWGLGLGTLQAGFGLYSGLKQLSLANKEFKLNKAIATQNMNNEVKQYNTNLQTTAGLRSSMEGTGGPNSQAANSFYNNNKLTGV